MQYNLIFFGRYNSVNETLPDYHIGQLKVKKQLNWLNSNKFENRKAMLQNMHLHSASYRGSRKRKRAFRALELNIYI